MPCTITGTIEGDRALFAQEAYASIQKSLKKSQAERLKLTQMLCVMCKMRDDGIWEMPPRVREWWVKHQKQDKRNRRKSGRK